MEYPKPAHSEGPFGAYLTEYSHLLVDGQHRLIARLPKASLDIPAEIQRANLVLFMVAPEMLAVLKQALAHLSNDPADLAMRLAIEAVIAKAQIQPLDGEDLTKDL